MKRLILWPGVLSIFLLTIFIVTVVSASESSPVLSLLSLSKDKEKKENIPISQQLNSMESLRSGLYEVDGLIKLPSEKKEIVVRRKKLMWKVSPTIESSQDWFVNDGVYTAKQGTDTSILKLQLFPISAASSSSIILNDYDQLWIDFSNFGNKEACNFSVSINSREENSQAGVFTSVSGFDLERLSDLKLKQITKFNIDKAKWSRRNFRYLINRSFGRSLGNYLYYKSGNNGWKIEYFVKQPLHDLDIIDLYFDSRVQPKSGYLRIHEAMILHSDIIIPWDKIPQKTEIIDGVMRIRLFVQGLKRDISPAKHFILSEVVIEGPGETYSFVKNKSWYSMIFQKINNKLSDYNVPLTTKRLEVTSNIDRIMVDLSELNQLSWSTKWLERAQISIKAISHKKYCSIKPLSIELVRLHQITQLKILGDMERFSRSLGGPFINNEYEQLNSEWIQKDAVLLFDSVLPKNLQSESPWGVTLIQDNNVSPINVSQRADEMLLGGKSSKFDLVWTHPFRISPGSRLLLDGDVEERKYLEILVDLHFADGTLVEKLPLFFNQPLLIANLKTQGKILNKITFHFRKLPERWRILLKKIVAFHPELIRSSEFYRYPIPESRWIQLAPMLLDKKTNSFHKYDHAINGVSLTSHSKKIVYQTKINLPAHVLQAYKIVYQVNRLLKGRCWMTLTLHGEQHHITTPVCTNFSKKDEIRVPLASLLSIFDPDEIILSADVQANITPRDANDITFSFKSLLLTDGISFASYLKQIPIMLAGYKKYMIFNEESWRVLFKGDLLMMHLGKINLSEIHKYVLKSVKIYSTDVHIQQMIFSNREPLRAEKKEQPLQQRGVFFYIMLIAAIFGLFYVFFFFVKNHTMKNLSSKLSDFINRCTYHSRLIVNALYRYILIYKRILNCVVGVASAVPFLWLYRHGYAENNHVLMGCMMLIMGCIWYEWKWLLDKKHKYKWYFYCFGDVYHIAPIVLTMTAIILLWVLASWSTKHSFFSQGFPLVTMGYYYLSSFKARWLSRLIWIGMLIMLYCMGIYEHNIFYLNIASIGDVFLLYILLQEIRLKIEMKYPSIVKYVSKKSGVPYFLFALIGMFFIAILLIIHSDIVAEHVALIVFNLLVLGVCVELYSVINGQSNN